MFNFLKEIYNDLTIMYFNEKMEQFHSGYDDENLKKHLLKNKAVIQKINNKPSEHKLRKIITQYIQYERLEPLEIIMNSGWNVNYLSYFEEFLNARLKTPIQTFDVLTKGGLTVNLLEEAHKNALSPLHYMIAKLKNPTINITLNSVRVSLWTTSKDLGVLSQTEEEEIKKTNYYPLFKHMLNQDVDLTRPRQFNLIAYALSTRSKLIIDDVLSIKKMNMNYIQKGIEIIKERDNLIDELETYTIATFEKYILDKSLSNNVSNKMSDNTATQHNQALTKKKNKI
jgi:hypothetical protein